MQYTDIRVRLCEMRRFPYYWLRPVYGNLALISGCNTADLQGCRAALEFFRVLN